MPDNGFKFVSGRKKDIVIFNLNFVLLQAEIDPILEEQGRNGDMLGTRGTSRIKMIIALLTEIITFYVRTIII